MSFRASKSSFTTTTLDYLLPSLLKYKTHTPSDTFDENLLGTKTRVTLPSARRFANGGHHHTHIHIYKMHFVAILGG